MPYVDALARHDLCHRDPETTGELTYRLTEDIVHYVTKRGLTFQTIAEVVGALESTKVEFERRVVAKYEDRKRDLNGDVYPTWMVE